MLGALAWQAATIIKMFFLSRGEIARGLSCFSPGFSPLCAGVLLCPHPSSDPTTWHNVLPSQIVHGATLERPKLEQL
uniref:Uncharacterized protein n=1 Tax=Triticum urartu TaxID=4572 RepID=A0A8R7Q530_TRIUA